MKYYTTDNCAAAVALKDIPEVEYAAMYEDLKERLKQSQYHVAHYFARTEEDRLKFYIILLDDEQHKIMISSFAMEYYDDIALPSRHYIHRCTPSSVRLQSYTTWSLTPCHGTSPCASHITAETATQQWTTIHSTLSRVSLCMR